MTTTTAKARVLVVDDSPLIRALLNRALARHPQIEVVGFASDGQDALAKIMALKPDAVTLDVEMPNLNGIGVLERLAGKVPVGFVMVSTLTEAGAQITFEALRKGAFDYVAKPQAGSATDPAEFAARLQEKVLAAAQSKGRVRRLPAEQPAGNSAAPKLPPNKERGWVVGIGISCGGPPTLTEMLPAFPSDFVPILITQHMPAQFTAAFAKQLDAVCAMRVREARDNELLQQGVILIAPGGQHLRIVRRGVDLYTKLDAGPKVSGHRPSADVMFSAMAQACGPRCVAAVMTGMGGDGAEGIRQLKAAGARTVAQDEETSMVFGMPKVAIETGCIDQIAPLSYIPSTIARLMRGGARAAVGAP